MENNAIKFLEAKASSLMSSISSLTRDVGLATEHLDTLKLELPHLKKYLKDTQEAITLLKQAELYGD